MCEETVSCTYVPGFHDEAKVRKMKYNYLGQTGFKVSEIALAGAEFHIFFGLYEEKECIATVREALVSGINYIDTAPWYGNSESILGKALKGIPRKSYYIATKVGRYQTDFENMFDYSAQKTRKSVENSLKVLGVDYIDIIQVQDIEFPPVLDQILNECLPTLKKFVKEGKVKYIGITGYCLSVLKKCIQESKIRISTVLTQARMTLIDDSLKDYLEFFKEKRVGVINSSALCMEMLTTGGSPPWHPASKETKEICAQAAEFCKSQDVELGRLALYYALSQNVVPTTVVRMKSPEVLNNFLEVYYNGLSCVEKSVLEAIQDRFFNKMEPHQRHWEGLELAEYLEKIGL